MITGHEALERLRQGNRRFATGARRRDTLTSEKRRSELLAGQAPFAVVLGCSDSRVPVELVFDQDLGNLFVIRVAGNIVAPSLIGSVEFAAQRFGTQLVVVLGHSGCGAVKATLEALDHPEVRPSPNLGSIVDRIRPAVAELWAGAPERTSDSLMREAVIANVRASVEQLRDGSAILEQLIEEDDLLVLGAKYSLDTGLVEFLGTADPAAPE